MYGTIRKDYEEFIRSLGDLGERAVPEATSREELIRWSRDRQAVYRRILAEAGEELRRLALEFGYLFSMDIHEAQEHPAMRGIYLIYDQFLLVSRHFADKLPDLYAAFQMRCCERLLELGYVDDALDVVEIVLALDQTNPEAIDTLDMLLAASRGEVCRKQPFAAPSQQEEGR